MESILYVALTNEDACIPTRGTDKSVGLDLYSIESKELKPGEIKKFDTGIAVKIPSLHYIRIADRSGLALKGIHTLGGVIDRDYTGPIGVILTNLSSNIITVNKNDRIAQMILERATIPIVKTINVKDLTSTERGSKGFGSTGV